MNYYVIKDLASHVPALQSRNKTTHHLISPPHLAISECPRALLCPLHHTLMLDIDSYLSDESDAHEN